MVYSDMFWLLEAITRLNIKECVCVYVCVCVCVCMYIYIYIYIYIYMAQWLRCCATNRKIAGSIPDGVIGIFH